MTVLTFVAAAAAACTPHSHVPADDGGAAGRVDAPEDSPLLACDGSVPSSLAECARGLYHADCGGDEGPILACPERFSPGGIAPCKWFTNGCVPESFRAPDPGRSDTM